MNIHRVCACLIPLFFMYVDASDTKPTKEEQQKHVQTALTIIQDLHEKIHSPVVPLVLEYVGNGISEIDLKSFWEHHKQSVFSKFGIYKIDTVQKAQHKIALEACFLDSSGEFLQAGTCVYDSQNDTVTINEEIRRITNYTCSSPTGRMRFMPRPIHTPEQLFQEKCSAWVSPQCTLHHTNQVIQVSMVGWVAKQGASVCNITKPHSTESYLAKAYSHFVMSQLKRKSNPHS